MPSTGYAARKQIIEKRLKTLIGGVPALVVNDTPNNEIVVEGFEGGYHYPRESNVGYVREEPQKDSYYEHVFNSIEYVAVNLFRPVEQVPNTQTAKRRIIRGASNAGFGYAHK